MSDHIVYNNEALEVTDSITINILNKLKNTILLERQYLALGEWKREPAEIIIGEDSDSYSVLPHLVGTQGYVEYFLQDVDFCLFWSYMPSWEKEISYKLDVIDPNNRYDIFLIEECNVVSVYICKKST